MPDIISAADLRAAAKNPKLPKEARKALIESANETARLDKIKVVSNTVEKNGK